MELLISSIPVSAPLFHKAPEDRLLKVVKLLSDASYHYADDSSKEWGRAASLVKEAAEEVNFLRLGFQAIEALYKHAPQLVSFSEFINEILKDARK
jgi:hypothetical protein